MLGVARRLLALAALIAAFAIVAVAPAGAATTGQPVRATLHLSSPDAFAVGGHLVTVPRRTIHIVGVVRPYVPDQTVLVKVLLGHRQIKTDVVRINSEHGGAYGQFTEPLSSPRAGQLTVQVGHTRNTAMGALLARRHIAALAEQAGFGSRGLFVELIQQRLAALHFYIPQTGVYDSGTGWAIDAYHRLLHRGTSQTLDGRTISYLLDGFGSFKVRFPSHGNHAEGNLSLQLLALASGSHVYRIYPISSGKPSTPTILGDFRVYSKVPGFLPDGMYYSN
ncbi:MAG: L,D-transpeptidase, partial [Solirubrobacterales bacterium]|nr:L,D-transpeptidase [Solirubrobacterales bacterium]